ncbi:MAG TPA: Hsp20/alpha crystallin family protein [Pirellulales bacterium]|nr:Hsp20/alpha crystallin family protein [Pirellulales bacterium]
MAFSLMPRRARTLPRPFERVVEEMEDLMERFWEEGDGRRMKLEAFHPRVNLAEKEGGFELTADLPGIKPEDIKVEMQNGNLMISGERKEEKEEKGKTFHLVESSYGSFYRSIPLPTPVEEGKIAAKFTDGVLHVTLPKSEKAKPKQIAVKS